MAAAITISNLSYFYQGQNNPALQHIQLNIEPGARFGLFGPNGAGKTTLMQCMTGLLQGGDSIRIFGKTFSANKKEILSDIGFVPQDFALFMELSVIENLEYFSAMYGIPKPNVKERCGELIAAFGLERYEHQQLRHLSGGQKRRVNLIIGILHKPKILFLDEPTVGVDVHSRQSIISYLKHLNAGGTTLVYTSHQLEEAQELCDQVALMHEGRILIQDELSTLLATHKSADLQTLFLSLTNNNLQHD